MSIRHHISQLLYCVLLALLPLAANANTKFTYFVNDAVGSPVVAMNQTGAVVWRKAYQPYGKASGKDRDNRIGYTGHVEDQPDLVYAGARYYDPALGRFLSDDPVRFTEKNPMSFNRYAYANNNPYKYVDPDGRKIEFADSLKNNASAYGSVLSQIAKLEGTKEGQRLVSQLKDSDHVFKIEYSQGRSNVDPWISLNENSRNGIGTGTTLFYDPKFMVPGSVFEDGKAYSGFTTLGHEFKHLSEIDKGQLDTSHKSGDPYGSHERRAVDSENIIRGEVGLSRRTKYAPGE